MAGGGDIGRTGGGDIGRTGGGDIGSACGGDIGSACGAGTCRASGGDIGRTGGAGTCRAGGAGTDASNCVIYVFLISSPTKTMFVFRCLMQYVQRTYIII